MQRTGQNARRQTVGEHVNKEQNRQAAPESAGNTPAHVLLVEDDDVMREMLAEALHRNGYRVTECADVFQWLLTCVRLATTPPSEHGGNKYDIVVSDIRMPNISGLGVLRILKDISCADSCPPTVFITAFGDEQTHRTARELGAVAVLDKPFAIEDLIASVRAVTTS